MNQHGDIPTDIDSLIRLARVASVDLAAARCVVELDEGVLSPPLRWLEPRMGATRTWSAPSPGEQVVVLCPSGEIGMGLVQRGLVCDAFAAPSGDQVDLIKYADGAMLEYDSAAGLLKIVLPGSIEITAPGKVKLTGDLEVTGKISASDDVLADGKSLKGHKHSGVQVGGSQTGAPV